MHSLFRILFSIAILIGLSIALIADTIIGSYTINGNITDRNKPLVNDSIKVVYHYLNKTVTSQDVHYIYTDSNGNYNITINWSAPCPSSQFTNCKGLSKDSCFHINSLEWNPEIIGFVYGQKEIKIYNKFWTFKKQHLYEQTIKLDLNF